LHFIFFMFVPDVASSTMFLYLLKSKPSLIVVVRAVCLDFYSGSSQATYGAGGLVIFHVASGASSIFLNNHETKEPILFLSVECFHRISTTQGISISF
jgi:hypothetical protein